MQPLRVRFHQWIAARRLRQITPEQARALPGPLTDLLHDIGLPAPRAVEVQAVTGPPVPVLRLLPRARPEALLEDVPWYQAVDELPPRSGPYAFAGSYPGGR